MGRGVRALAGPRTAQHEDHLRRRRREDVGVRELVLQFLVDLGHSLSRIDADAVVLFFETLDDGHRFVGEGVQTLLDSVGVVIRTPAGLSALHYAVHQNLRGAVKVDEVADDHFPCELLLELLPVLLVAGESIEEVATLAIGLNAPFEQLHHKFGRQQFALLDVVVDGLRQFAALQLLLPQQVARRQVLEFVVADQVLRLCALPAAWTS